MDIDLSDLLQLAEGLVDDVDRISSPEDDAGFIATIEDIVASDVQYVFDSNGGPYSWPAGVDGVDTGALRDSWTVGSIDINVYGDTLIFGTSVMDDYGQYFDDAYGLIGEEIVDRDSISDAYIEWVNAITALDWR
jgi:hypothetical protein